MLIKSKYTKQIDSYKLTNTKYQLIYNYAVYLRNIKNDISQLINNDIFKYIDMSNYDFVIYMRHNYKNKINSYFDDLTFRQILDAYKNKFESIKNKIQFKHKLFNGFEYYKKDCKSGKKGQIKKVNFKIKTTKLTITLTYLVRYGNENILNYINNQLNILNKDDKKYNFYIDILNCINKFGFDRLYKLSQKRKQRILKYYNNPIEFKSLTFSGRYERKRFFDYNDNKKSIINSFCNIVIPDINNKSKLISIPTKYSKKYHGNLSLYKKQSQKYFYTIKFNNKNAISILYCIDGMRNLINNKNSFIGIDVNLKHNMFSLSNNDIYNYDNNLINELIKEYQNIDKLKLYNKNYKIGKRKQNKLNSLNRQLKNYYQRTISSMCKKLNNEHIDHIVMENLNNSFTKSYIKNKNIDIKYTRLSHILNIASLKDLVKSISIKYNIQTTFIHPEYTSIQCPICGCIMKENRLSQENFKCCNCGHEDNADHNAAINIKNRVSKTVFRNLLFNINDNNEYIMKKIKHDKIYSLLSSVIQTNINSQ